MCDKNTDALTVNVDRNPVSDRNSSQSARKPNRFYTADREVEGKCRSRFQGFLLGFLVNSETRHRGSEQPSFYWSRGSVNVNTSRVTHDNRLLLHTLYMTPDEKCVVRGFVPGSIYPER